MKGNSFFDCFFVHLILTGDLTIASIEGLVTKFKHP